MSKGKKYFITAGVCVLLAFFCFCGAAVTKDGDKYYLEKNQKKEKSYRTVGWFFALNAALDVCVGGYCLGAEVDSLLSKNNDERKIIRDCRPVAAW